MTVLDLLDAVDGVRARADGLGVTVEVHLEHGSREAEDAWRKVDAIMAPWRHGRIRVWFVDSELVGSACSTWYQLAIGEGNE